MLPRPAESTFLKMRGVVGRVCAAWVTARAAAVGERSRLAVWRTQTVSGASGLGVSRTRAVWPWRRKAAALSQAPVRSSARSRIWGRDGAEEGDCAGISVTDWELISLVLRALSAATLFSSVYLNFRSAWLFGCGFSGWGGVPPPWCILRKIFKTG